MKIADALQVLGFASGNGLTEELIKSAYRQKAKENHPDKGGDLRTMQFINEAKETLLGLIKEKPEWISGATATQNDVLQEFKDILEVLNGLSEVVVELCGCWLWIEASKAVKDVLKENGCKWAAKKKKWYWRPDFDKKLPRFRKKKEWSMNEIRNNFGSEIILKKQAAALR